MDGKASHSSGAPSLLICRVHHGNVSGRTQLLNAAYVLVKEHAVAKKKSGDAVRSYSKPAQTEASVSFTRLLIHHRSLLMTSTWCRYYRQPVMTRGICTMLVWIWMLGAVLYPVPVPYARSPPLLLAVFAGYFSNGWVAC